MGKTRATDTEKRNNILEKGRFLLADYCEIGVEICTKRTELQLHTNGNNL
jgi:hypothetical protein